MKLDLHTHSVASPDATITLEQLEKAFSEGIVDQVAITDHDEVNFALEAQKHFGEDKIIVGEEVTTAEGTHLIGLFIREFVPKGLPVKRTAQLIKNQQGLVYVPHPFKVKNGLGLEAVEELRKFRMIDIIEEFNSWERFVFPISMSGKKALNDEAMEYAEEHEIPSVAASDAHVYSDLGHGTVEIEEVATRRNIVEQLKSDSKKLNKKYNSVRPSHFRAGFKYMGKKLPFVGA